MVQFYLNNSAYRQKSLVRCGVFYLSNRSTCMSTYSACLNIRLYLQDTSLTVYSNGLFGYFFGPFKARRWFIYECIIVLFPLILSIGFDIESQSWNYYYFMHILQLYLLFRLHLNFLNCVLVFLYNKLFALQHIAH
jgi:hypothetical protein